MMTTDTKPSPTDRLHTELEELRSQLRAADRDRDRHAVELEHAGRRLTEAQTEIAGQRDDALRDHDTQQRRADRAEARADAINAESGRLGAAEQ